MNALTTLIDSLREKAGNNLAGLITHGPVGDARRALIILLRDASAPSLSPLASALQTHRRENGLEFMLATPEEIHRAADVFPVKFLAIQRSRVVLYGEDPFASLEISPANLRLRLEQEFRNLTLRLRRAFIETEGDELARPRRLAQWRLPLLNALRGLLDLVDAAPEEETPEQIFARAAQRFDLDHQLLKEFEQMATTPSKAPRPDLFEGMINLLSRAAMLTDELEETP